jgi:hypothetical protein
VHRSVEPFKQRGAGSIPARLTRFSTGLRAADAVAMFDLPIHARPPALLARTMVRLIVATSERWNLPLAGAGDIGHAQSHPA